MASKSTFCKYDVTKKPKGFKVSGEGHNDPRCDNSTDDDTECIQKSKLPLDIRLKTVFDSPKKTRHTGGVNDKELRELYNTYNKISKDAKVTREDMIQYLKYHKITLKYLVV